MLKVLDLFSGIGGFSLGLERTGFFKTVGFCEIEEYPRKVLRKHWPDVPIFEDIRTLTGEQIREKCGAVDVITGGYPCQPFSHAGKRGGHQDDRHLWPAMFEVIKAVRPAWVIGENVAGHITLGLDEVLSDLEAEGYAARPFVIPACAVDAPHRRDRVWIVANCGRKGVQQRREPSNARPESSGQGRVRSHGLQEKQKPKGQVLAHAKSKRRGKEGQHSQRPEERATGSCALADPDNPGGTIFRGGRNNGAPSGACGQKINKLGKGIGTNKWLPEPDVGRVANGVPSRVDRLKCLGNAIVPQIVEQIGYAIMETKEHE